MVWPYAWSVGQVSDMIDSRHVPLRDRMVTFHVDLSLDAHFRGRSVAWRTHLARLWHPVSAAAAAATMRHLSTWSRIRRDRACAIPVLCSLVLMPTRRRLGPLRLGRALSTQYFTTPTEYHQKMPFNEKFSVGTARRMQSSSSVKRKARPWSQLRRWCFWMYLAIADLQWLFHNLV